MTWGARKSDRVSFANGLAVHIMAIDGSWRRACKVLDISTTGARLATEDSLTGLNLKEFFLVLSTSGRVSRRCGLIRVNGEEMGVSFITERARSGKKKAEGAK
jgi:hypothetical protein